MKYLVVVERSENGYGAYVPDLPGCVAASESRSEVVALIQEAIEFHIDALKAAGEIVNRDEDSEDEVVYHAMYF